jgi:hypothetical protein
MSAVSDPPACAAQRAGRRGRVGSGEHRTNDCHARCAGGAHASGVACIDAADAEHRNRCRGAGRGQLAEIARRPEGAFRRRVEQRAEDGEVGAGGRRGGHLGGAVGRDPDQPLAAEQVPRVSDGERVGRQVHAVRLARQRHVDAVVDQQGCAVRAGQRPQVLRHGQQRTTVEIALAQLHRSHPTGERRRHHVAQRPSRRLTAVGDEIHAPIRRVMRAHRPLTTKVSNEC